MGWLLPRLSRLPFRAVDRLKGAAHRVTARIPHSKPWLPSDEEWPAVTGRLRPGSIAGGPCAEQFAGEASEWLGGTAGVAVNSGTSALHLALLAVGVRERSEVLVPAYSCAALLNAVRLAGAVPVLVDSEPDGFNLCADDARRRLTKRAAAIVVAHMFGQPAPVDRFLDLAIPVIEDCAQSLGARAAGTPCGGLGRAAISSFYATKVITTGQGGLVSCRETALLAAVLDRVEYDNRDEWRPRFNELMSELPAALGLWQLERLPAFLERRRALASFYDEQLGLSGSRAHCPGAIYYRYVLRVADAASAIHGLQALDIDAKRPVYRPLHQYLGGDFPHAQAAHEQLVSLPLYPALSDAEADRIVAAVRAVGPRIWRC
jgi:perosamine synthetase